MTERVPGMILLSLIILAITLYTIYIQDKLKNLYIKGTIIKSVYEAIHDRFYFVLMLDDGSGLLEYLEYTCKDKAEWIQYQLDDEVLCEVTYNQLGTFIKSITK